jgi:hypothetical protein
MVTGRTVRVPLVSASVRATGETVIKAVLSLLIETRQGRLKPIDFPVDSGSSITTIAIADATQTGIAVPAQVVNLDVTTATGKTRQRRRPGRISVQIPGLEGCRFVWPCHFIEYQTTPPTSALGLAGVLDDLRIIFDGSYALEAPYGWLILEERRP